MTPPFLGPVFTEDGPLLVAELGRRGTHPEHHRRATRLVIDDYGDAVAYARRCGCCWRWLPLDFEHFAPRGNYIGLGMQARCKQCTAQQSRMVRRDPVRGACARETQRLGARLRSERETGRHVSTIATLRPWGSVRPRERDVRLPVWPLVLLVAARVVSSNDVRVDALVGGLGLNGRLWFEWRTGRRDTANFETADAVLVGLGLNPWDVWRPEDDPEAYELAARLWGFDAQAVA